ncbi:MULTISPECIES: deoxyribose-phosphate aldolase [Aneurinibacillus]|jgi:deoxyribose-phosphate aldolase|uniref:Deoxyribose-phosphate aldolase n=1 Tax=Aneurinibacillus thermoaerophilus TaxID=143495 RepID=A0A1G7Z5V5_ANETH|nr:MULTISPECIES: deoxyribose-phosphate aldolase [Aneurinibacillus]AMA72337.1 2-deoxyribose-5-phosphate aldolase [Aneurinibacillus sp. XH2]MED0679760.1 deoxyribose-phosphate aldolase [Aneurinibacillus thermoaerophilus]MED0735792.1 deoxyribose-phosphate aldolase [Aneurinibacillus thermoaerophilus]MED0763984.1 deoxyribose-phosphate aldolase [Aneurinibacillus thermoaerophilus]QYY41908.1 deoxyribose-phosphate aldolase [Aneurinibacillus thermoaerophilus]
MTMEPGKLATYIDHTLLKPETTAGMIDKLCQEAKEHRFFAVCINPYWVERAKQNLVGSDIKVATVIGFPLGASIAEVKAFEAARAIKDGADEIDMVINIGALKSGDDEAVLQDIAGVVAVAGDDALVKVIIETGLLTEEEKVRACRLSKEAGAHFVKTSTGFLGGGATVEDVALMRKTVGEEMGVKASGGVRTFEDAEAMIQAGATRIGTSGGVAIVQGGTNAEQY